MKKLVSIVVFSMVTMLGTYAHEGINGHTSEGIPTTVNEEINLLCKAAMEGDVDQVRSLIALGNEPNEKSLGLTPAMYAARYNKADVLKVLLLNGANLAIKSDKGYTAKEYAEMSNAKEALLVMDSE